MKKLVLFLALTISFAGTAQEKKNKNAKVSIEVNGNCEQCKRRIEKAAFSVGGVKSATWHIDTHQLDLIINEQKCSLADVEAAVAKVGHDNEGAKATDEAYGQLHACCKYERE